MVANIHTKQTQAQYKKILETFSLSDFKLHLESLNDADFIRAVSTLDLKKRKLSDERVQILLDFYTEQKYFFIGFDYEKRLAEAVSMGKDLYFVYFKLCGALYIDRYTLKADKNDEPELRRIQAITGINKGEWADIREDIIRKLKVYNGYCYFPWLSYEMLVAQAAHHSASVRGTAGGLQSAIVRGVS